MSLHPRTRRHALVVCAVALVAVLTCAALVGAAVLVPAPAPAVPMLCVVCLGCPLVVGGELRDAVGVLRGHRRRLRPRDVAELRRELAQLPEVDHPLGL